MLPLQRLSRAEFLGISLAPLEHKVLAKSLAVSYHKLKVQNVEMRVSNPRISARRTENAF